MPTDRTSAGAERGRLDEIVEQLTRLHAQAGLLSSRKIAEAIPAAPYQDIAPHLTGPLTVSHETVSAMLRGAGLPRWPHLAAVVWVLADRSAARHDAAAEVRRFREMWLRANGMPTIADRLSQIGSPDVRPAEASIAAGSSERLAAAFGDSIRPVVAALRAKADQLERVAETGHGGEAVLVGVGAKAFTRNATAAFVRVLWTERLVDGYDEEELSLIAERLACAAFEVFTGVPHPLAPLIEHLSAERHRSGGQG